MLITVTTANVGLTLASNGTLNSIEFVDPPSRFGDGVFRLVNRDINGFETQLHCEDMSRSLAPPRSNCALVYGWGYVLLANGNIGFSQLVCTHCPPNAKFELTVS